MSQRLLSFSLLTDKDTLSADADREYFSYILKVYDKEWENVAAFIGDKSSTYRSFARKAATYFIECASHWLNLATKARCRAHNDLFNKINNIMSKLKRLYQLLS
jgi:hypothetical protein